MAEELRREIEACNVEFMKRFDENDMKGLSELYTEDCKVMPTGSKTIVGREGTAALFGAVRSQGVAKAVLEVQEVGVIHSDNTAYERSTYTFYNKDGGVFDEGKYVVIWKKIDGCWYLYTDIFNSNK